MRLHEASSVEAAARDVAASREWNFGLRMEQYVRREVELRAHDAFVREARRCWFLVTDDYAGEYDGAKVLASCETFLAPSVAYVRRGTAAAETHEGWSYLLGTVLVEPVHRRRGYARELIHHVQEWARACSQRPTAMVLFSDVDTDMYRKMGFTVSCPSLEWELPAGLGAASTGTDTDAGGHAATLPVELLVEPPLAPTSHLLTRQFTAGAATAGTGAAAATAPATAGVQVVQLALPLTEGHLQWQMKQARIQRACLVGVDDHLASGGGGEPASACSACGAPVGRPATDAYAPAVAAIAAAPDLVAAGIALNAAAGAAAAGPPSACLPAPALATLHSDIEVASLVAAAKAAAADASLVDAHAERGCSRVEDSVAAWYDHPPPPPRPLHCAAPCARDGSAAGGGGVAAPCDHGTAAAAAPSSSLSSWGRGLRHYGARVPSTGATAWWTLHWQKDIREVAIQVRRGMQGARCGAVR